MNRYSRFHCSTVCVADGTNEDKTGKAYLFTCSLEKMDCIQLGDITPPDASEGDMFGRGVAVANGLLAISAPFGGEGGEEKPGVVFVYVCEFARSCLWILKLSVSEAQDDAFFGSSLAVFNQQIAIGAQKQEGNMIIMSVLMSDYND